MISCNIVLLEPRRLHADVLRRGLASSQPAADVEIHDDGHRLLADLADRAETGALTPDLLIISCDRVDKHSVTRSLRRTPGLENLLIVQVDEEPEPGEGYRAGADMVVSKPLGPTSMWRLGRTLGHMLDCPPAAPWPGLEEAWHADTDSIPSP